MNIVPLTVGDQLKIVQGKIRMLPLSRYYKSRLFEDLECAERHLAQNNPHGVLNCLMVVCCKLHAWETNACAFGPLIADLLKLQQMLLLTERPHCDAGPTGATGPRGLIGPPGPQGPAGPGRVPQYAFIYNISEQTIPIGANVPFDTNGIITAGISHLPGSEEVHFHVDGDYQIIFLLVAHDIAQFGLFLNNRLLPGSIHGVGTSNAINSGFVIEAITAPSVLTLRNYHSFTPVLFTIDQGGIENTINASLRINKVG